MKHTYQRMQPHIQDGRFYNHPSERPHSFFARMLQTYTYSLLTRKRQCPTDMHHWVEQQPLPATLADSCVVWLGHATFLIRLNGITVITDPILGHLPPWYTRLLPTHRSATTVPALDAILISHNHRDHLDIPTLQHLHKLYNPRILVPKGDKGWLEKTLNSNRVEEYSWWESTTISALNKQALATFLPAWHWSQRGFFDKNKSLWGSWLLQQSGDTLYFAGDTAYSSHFSVIKQECPPITLALLPIGPHSPRAWMAPTHIAGQETIQAFLDLEAQHLVPMHWGTFGFGIDSFYTPLQALLARWHQHRVQLSNRTLHLPKIGSIITW